MICYDEFWWVMINSAQLYGILINFTQLNWILMNFFKLLLKYDEFIKHSD